MASSPESNRDPRFARDTDMEARAAIGCGSRKNLSPLGDAMRAEIQTRTQELFALFDRVQGRGYTFALAFSHARQHLKEAEMWAVEGLTEL